jgi:hypothetical protein
MSRSHWICGAALLFAVTCVVAGTIYEYKCGVPTCGFKGRLNLGGGLLFDQVTGYCASCRKFVPLRWKSQRAQAHARDQAVQLPERAPEPVGSVWNFATGRAVKLYTCPDCAKPFMELQAGDFGASSGGVLHKSYCPMCTNRTLEFTPMGVYD